jgi:hypothetical protein
MSILRRLLGWSPECKRVSNRERLTARNGCEGEAALSRNPHIKVRDEQAHRS